MTNQIAEMGRKFYEENLKQILEPAHNGEFVSIEPESGQYFLGKTDVEAMRISKVAIPDKIKCLIRIGAKSTYKFGGLNAGNKRQTLRG